MREYGARMTPLSVCLTCRMSSIEHRVWYVVYARAKIVALRESHFFH